MVSTIGAQRIYYNMLPKVKTSGYVFSQGYLDKALQTLCFYKNSHIKKPLCSLRLNIPFLNITNHSQNYTNRCNRYFGNLHCNTLKTKQ